MCEIGNLSDGAWTLLKTLGAVALAAVVLYVVLVLVRVAGNKLEAKSYQRYVEKCRNEGTAPLSYQDYVERRAKGEKVLWCRDSNAAMPQSGGETDDTADAMVGSIEADEATDTTDDTIVADAVAHDQKEKVSVQGASQGADIDECNDTAPTGNKGSGSIHCDDTGGEE